MKIAFITGAGISAESGLQTFRGTDGLWEGYRIEEVATPDAWKKNAQTVQEFYNLRRKAVLAASPNAAHIALANLQKTHVVTIITQNIDNLHERAGSKHVLHLHGEITKSRSTKNQSLVYDIEGWELKMGETCELGSQLRPHIVWFGEQVPLIETAANIVTMADAVVVIGTSLLVYPAAGLIRYAAPNVPVVVVDPNCDELNTGISNTIYIKQPATTGVQYFIDEVLEKLR